MTMSVRAMSSRKTSLPEADFKTRASERLLRFRRTKLDDSAPRNGAVWRTMSPPAGFSTLITSAPRSASCIPQKGPAMKLPTSSTRTPSNGGGLGMVEKLRELRFEHGGRIRKDGLE